MNAQEFLQCRGIFPEQVQMDLGRAGLASSMAELVAAAENRLLEIDQRIEIVRHLLLIAQPRRIGRLQVTWRVQHGHVRPRVIQWLWARKKRCWIAWSVPDVQIHRHLHRTGPFLATHDLSRALVSLLAHLLRLRSELLRSLQQISMALKYRIEHDPFPSIDAALDRMARDALHAPLG